MFVSFTRMNESAFTSAFEVTMPSDQAAV
jgi:hypothetical protein